MKKKNLVAILSLSLIGTIAANTSLADDITGLAQVIDGDSLYVAAHEIRLQGIDAPEWKQACERDGKQWKAGQEATAWVRSFLAGKIVSCTKENRDRYGRTIATCYVEGKNLNRQLVKKGWAFAYLHYSHRYENDEKKAIKQKVGIWEGKCLPPWDWRKSKK